MQKEDILSKIEKGIANEEVPSEEIIKDAELLAKQLYGKPKKINKTFWLTFQSAALACFILTISVFFLVNYFKPNSPSEPETRYFDNQNIETSDISDLGEYLKGNSLKINYYNGELIIDSVAHITETKELALIIQNGLIITETSFDQIELYVNLIPNATYEKLNAFNDLEQESTMEGINIKYDSSLTNDGMTKIMAKFSLEKDYYLQITTIIPDGKLDYYIKTLISK